mgnify:FL=1
MRLTPRGKLAALLVVQERSATILGDGSTRETWADSRELFAHVETRGGVDKAPANDLMVGMERRVAVVDFDEDWQWSIRDHRLKHGETILNITAVSDPNLLHWKVELTVEELVT